MPLKSDVIMKRIMDKSEELIGRITNQVLANEKFLAALQQMISKAVETKGRVDKNVQQALSTLNLPSTADIQKFQEKLAEFEELLDGMDGKVDKILKKLDGGK
jgi:type I restriction-modification system DNA methylase subunit